MKTQLNYLDREYEIDFILEKLADAYNWHTSKDLELARLQQELAHKDKIICGLQKHLSFIIEDRSKMLEYFSSLHQEDLQKTDLNISERLTKLENVVLGLKEAQK